MRYSLYLTPAERRVARHVLLGMDNYQIANTLGMTHQTVKNHMRSLTEKIGAHGRLELYSMLLNNPEYLTLVYA